MACKQQKLTCSSGFAINSGYNYTFNVNANIDLSAGTVHFNIKSKNDPSYLFQLTNTNDDSISGLFEVNMSNGVFDVNIIGLDSEGEYVELLNSDSRHYGGSDIGNSRISTIPREHKDRPHQLLLDLPPLAGLILARA